MSAKDDAVALIKKSLLQAEAEWRERLDEAEEAEQEVAHLRSVLALLEERTIPSKSEPGPVRRRRPRANHTSTGLTVRLRELLPTKTYWLTKDLKAACADIVSNSSTVNATLAYMEGRGEVEHVDVGKWAWKTPTHS